MVQSLPAGMAVFGLFVGSFLCSKFASISFRTSGIGYPAVYEIPYIDSVC